MPLSSESEFHESVWSGSGLIHALFALLVAVFVTETYRLIFQAGWISIPGGVIVGYIVITGAVVVSLLVTTGSKRVYLCSEMVAVIRDDWLFLGLYLSLVCLGLGIWLSDISADPLLLIDIIKSLLTCIGTMLLVRLCYQMRSGWRVYLSIGFVVYCLSIWVDALWPGTFTEIAGLGNLATEGQVNRVSGLNHDPNSGSYIVIFLSIALLDYRRFRVINLLVLSFATLSILLTLSRSGLFIFVLTAICYLSLIVANSSGRRWFVAGSFAITAAVTVFCGWAAIRLIEHFETPKARIAVGQLLIQDEWFRTRLSASNEDLIQAHLQVLERFGQVNAPKAPELMFRDQVVTGPITSAASNTLSPDEVRSYITYVDGGEYAHIESRRMARLRNALDAIAESPLIGHGIGFNRNAGISAHNMFLAMWIDFGLLGLALYTAPLVLGFLKFYRSRYWLGMFFIASFSAISIFVHHIFTLYTAFFVMGLVLSLKPEVASDMKLSVQ